MDQRQGPGPADRNPLGDKGPAQGPGNDKPSLLDNLKTDFKDTFNLKNLAGFGVEKGIQSLMSNHPGIYGTFGLIRGIPAIAEMFGLEVSPGEMTQEDMDKAAKQDRPLFNQPAEPSFSYNDPLLMERYQAYLQAGYPPELADYLVNTLT
jgi:hypothetical protein